MQRRADHAEGGRGMVKQAGAEQGVAREGPTQQGRAWQGVTRRAAGSPSPWHTHPVLSVPNATVSPCHRDSTGAEEGPTTCHVFAHSTKLLLEYSADLSAYPTAYREFLRLLQGFVAASTGPLADPELCSGPDHVRVLGGLMRQLGAFVGRIAEGHCALYNSEPSSMAEQGVCKGVRSTGSRGDAIGGLLCGIHRGGMAPEDPVALQPQPTMCMSLLRAWAFPGCLLGANPRNAHLLASGKSLGRPLLRKGAAPPPAGEP